MVKNFGYLMKAMFSHNFKKIALLLMIILFMLILFASVTVKAQTDALTEINSAKNQIQESYQLALDAEESSADITELTNMLNQAVRLLSQAETAYSNNDLTTAQNLASQSQAALEGFADRADILKENAIQQNNYDLMIFIGSIVGAFAVLAGGVAVWLFLKKKYGVSGAFAVAN